MDYIRMVFDRLRTAGSPTATERECIYQDCRDEVAALAKDEVARTKTLDALEKVIRRQEMQALYEETNRAR
ncbi:MAG: hypothetical protein K9J42_07895 [Sulfuritalea sp.]|nr:hypothetical protein [Sulfuritalea sp.]